MESNLKTLKVLLDRKVKFAEHFKIGKSGKDIRNVNLDYCHPIYFFPEFICESKDEILVNRLEHALIRYSRDKYPGICENQETDSSFEMADENNGSYMIFVAIKKPK
jgi:hypothetical protein